jgi:xylulokinase
MADCFLAIDVGTQSSRAALVDFSGKIIASAAQGYDLDSPAPGWAQQDARMWWQVTIQNIRTVLADSGIVPGRIAAVAACGQMHATIPLDRSGEVLIPAVQLWCDKRSADIITEIGSLPEIRDAYKLVGNIPQPAWLGWKIKWVQRHQPEVYQKTWKFLDSTAYIVYQLTGGEPVIDYAEASGSFLMDAGQRQWSSVMFDLLGLAADKLPPIYPASQVAGQVSLEAARLTGLAVGTPVAVGTGDMLSTLLAAGLTAPRMAVDITGTSSIMCIYTSEPVMDRRLMNLHHSMPGWITFGIIDSGGGALKWFKDTFGQEEIQEAARTGISPYRSLDQKAAQTPAGAEGLLFFPYLIGERTLGSSHSRGVFFGLTPRSSKGAMARAIMEGVSFELRRTLEIVQKGGMQIGEIRVVGGGAQSPFWCQVKADIYQAPVAVLENFEGGILGSAILAGVAAGVYPDETSAARQVVRVDRLVYPDPGLAGRYDRLFTIFKDLHDRMIEPFENLTKVF